MIVGGDFEQNTIGSTPTGWIVAPGDEIGVLDELLYQSCCGGSNAGVNKFVAFGGGDRPNVSTLEQAVTTVDGGQYLLSFRFGTFGGTAQTLTAAVLDSANNLVASGSFTRAASTNFAQLYGNFDLAFTGPGGATRIRFSVDPGTAARDGILDDVALNGPAVPEPANWALMIAGFALAGAAARRARSAGQLALQR